MEITVSLLGEYVRDMRATDFHGHTAIAWAARRGHEGVVRVLLERSEVSPDTPVVMGTIMIEQIMGAMLDHDLIEGTL